MGAPPQALCRLTDEDPVTLKTYRSSKVVLVVNELWCKGCAICVEVCPQHIIVMNPMDKPEIPVVEPCTKCLRCELLCPDFAIVVNSA